MNKQPTIRKAYCVPFTQFEQVVNGLRSMGFVMCPPFIYVHGIDGLLYTAYDGKVAQLMVNPKNRTYSINLVAPEHAVDFYKNGEPLFGLHVRINHD